MKKFAVGIILVSLLFVSCTPNAVEVGPSEVGYIRVQVLDGASSLPLYGAQVVIPEISGRFFTDRYGYTECITVPIIPDDRYDAMLPANEGRVTLIVSAEGMTTCLLLYVRVKPDEEREPIPVLMFPDDGTLEVFTMIEAPSEEWSRAFVDLYK